MVADVGGHQTIDRLLAVILPAPPPELWLTRGVIWKDGQVRGLGQSQESRCTSHC